MVARFLRVLLPVTLALAVGAGTTAGAMGGCADSFLAQQWGLGRIGAQKAWSVATGNGVTIGIVDTGVDLNHEDLAGKVVASTSCIGSGGDPARCGGDGQDDNGHGTHVSGIAAASTGNGVGVAGVAPDARLVVAKALDANGSGGSDDIDAGIEWVVDHGAKVVNLSLGGNFVVTNVLGNPLSDGIEYAWNHGAIAVLAAGNDSLFLVGGSQNYGSTDAVVVGASGPNDTEASYSSDVGNAKWALLAPGGDGAADPAHQIVSTYWTSSNARTAYAVLEGTSMATPHVTGALALLLQRGLGRDAAVQRLLATVDTSVKCRSNCRGRLDAARAVGASSSATFPCGASPTTVAPAPAAAPSGSGSAPAAAARPAGPSQPAGPAPAAVSATNETTTVPASDQAVGAGPAPASGVAAGLSGSGPATAGHRHHSSALAIGLLAAAIAVVVAGMLGVAVAARRRSPLTAVEGR